MAAWLAFGHLRSWSELKGGRNIMCFTRENVMILSLSLLDLVGLTVR